MSSGSVSTSDSESCCVPVDCICDDWLTHFCDYVPLTVEYCGETTAFERARTHEVPVEVVDPQSGVYPSDRIFEISMQEEAIDVSVGATVTDADGTEWVVYRVEVIKSFCLRRLWGRSVATCFSLMDTVEIIEQDCSCSDCGSEDRWDLVGRIRGSIRVDRGNVRAQNDSRDIAYTYTGRLARWPLEALPSSAHRLRTKKGLFRIQSFTDAGEFVPFTMVLEKEHADCSVRGSH